MIQTDTQHAHRHRRVLTTKSLLCLILRSLSMVGLILIALGTGGIKPCVAAFGGDQFQDHQVRWQTCVLSCAYRGAGHKQPLKKMTHSVIWRSISTSYICVVPHSCLLTNKQRSIMLFKAGDKDNPMKLMTLVKKDFMQDFEKMQPQPPVSCRRSREAPSSPSSTCPSTLAACCLLSSHPS